MIAPCFHSCRIPTIKISKNKKLINIQYEGKQKYKFTIAGRISTISTSKIRKMIVIKKNRSENGSREEDFWSNPHSKGESFSRSNKDLWEIIKHANISKLAINIIKRRDNIMFRINYNIIVCVLLIFV